MQEFLEIWKQICESNLFNFVVMILLLAWMIKKFDLGNKIEAGRKKIEKNISDSETAKDDSLTKLYDVQENVTKIDEEMLKIFKTAENNAKIIGEKIIEESKLQSESIKENSRKTIESNVKTIKTEIVKETAEEALILAEKQIKSELEKDSSLHNKFINESLDAINEIEMEI